MQNTNHIYQLPSLSSFPHIIHGYSTSFFGNMGDEVSGTSSGLRRFAESLTIPHESIVRMRQIHSANIHIVTKNEQGTSIADTDALIVKEKNIFLTVRVADCLPILIYDAKNQIVAAVHAGWRGVFHTIVAEVIQKIQEIGGSMESLHVVVGPSIHVCCYEVGEDRHALFADKFKKWDDKISENKNDRWFLNLQEIARLQMLELGVVASNIEISSICTNDSQDFFSYRKEVIKENSRRFAGIIGIV